MSDFFSFRTMITPVIIQIIFWVGVALCIIFGLGAIFFGSQYGNGGIFWGILVLIFGPLLVRIYCEILIVFFRINETLTEIKHTLEERRAAPAPPPPSSQA